MSLLFLAALIVACITVGVVSCHVLTRRCQHQHVEIFIVDDNIRLSRCEDCCEWDVA